MPYTPKQKRLACAKAAGADIHVMSDLSMGDAHEMCHARIKRAKKKPRKPKSSKGGY